METTLIYNPQAGNTSQLKPEDILEALRQAGYEPHYSPTATEEELDDVLANVKDSVVVTGGDGSIRAAAVRLLGRDVRIAPLPLGTANNICRMLGFTAAPLEIIAGLADPAQRDMDMGSVTTPQGPHYFIEAMGIGMFADVLEKYNPDDGKSVRRGVKTLLKTLNGYQPKFFHINVDGEDLSGSYFLCEIMNTPTVGFHYMLAPNAKTDDGLFDLVLIHANQRKSYMKFMKAVLTRTLESLPDVSIRRGSKLEIAWRGFPLHLDGEVAAGLAWMEDHRVPSQPEEPELLDVSKPFLQVELMPKAVHFLLPKTAANTEPPEATSL